MNGDARRPTVALIATLDTKGAESAYVRERLSALGVDATIIDSGIINEPAIVADVSREEVASRSGSSLAAIQAAGSRGAAVELMQEALRSLAKEMFAAGQVDGVLSIGGAEGAQLGAAFMHALPIGVPKIIVSPSASGRREFYPFVGSSDVMVMHSVIDILGLNAVARSVFDNAAAAIAGMCRWAGGPPRSDRPSVGITMLGQTTPGAQILVKRLEDAGYEPIIFHANGVGGSAMDAMAREGVLAAVIDFTLSEPANAMFNGVHTARPDRMRGAIDAGVPLLVVPGAADFFNQGALDSLPVEYQVRQHYKHNPVATLVRVERDEMVELGLRLSAILNETRAPTRVLFPTEGFSLIGVKGGPIEDREADSALLASLRESLREDIPIEIHETDINSVEFGNATADTFLHMMEHA